MLPVYPVNVNEPLFDPVQTVSPPETIPPLLTGDTLIVDTDERAAAQVAFCTIALYFVVTVRLR